MVNSFINQPDESIKRISGPAPAYQSFTERKKLERQRRIVKSYRDSHLGSVYGVRGSVRPVERASSTAPSVQKAAPTRQELNANNPRPVATPGNMIQPPAPAGNKPQFVEPTTRGYNPYA